MVSILRNQYNYESLSAESKQILIAMRKDYLSQHGSLQRNYGKAELRLMIQDRLHRSPSAFTQMGLDLQPMTEWVKREEALANTYQADEDIQVEQRSSY